eukprot:2389484-Rhodomonas_salina.3
MGCPALTSEAVCCQGKSDVNGRSNVGWTAGAVVGCDRDEGGGRSDVGSHERPRGAGQVAGGVGRYEEDGRRVQSRDVQVVGGDVWVVLGPGADARAVCHRGRTAETMAANVRGQGCGGLSLIHI